MFQDLKSFCSSCVKRCASLLLLICVFSGLDTLTKEEFYLKQNVEPFVHYKEKQATFECITRENIEAVAAKVCHYCLEAACV